jgi:hypothetical protein
MTLSRQPVLAPCTGRHNFQRLEAIAPEHFQLLEVHAYHPSTAATQHISSRRRMQHAARAFN